MPKMTYGMHNKATLQNLVGRLERLSEKLAATGESHEALGLDEIRVAYHDETIKAIKKIETFADAAAAALDDARRVRGDYGVSVEVEVSNNGVH